MILPFLSTLPDDAGWRRDAAGAEHGSGTPRALTLSAVVAKADLEHCLAAGMMTKPKSEYSFPTDRRRSAAAAWS